MNDQWRFLGPALTFRSSKAGSLSYYFQTERIITDDWFTGLSDSLKKEIHDAKSADV